MPRRERRTELLKAVRAAIDLAAQSNNEELSDVAQALANEHGKAGKEVHAGNSLLTLIALFRSRTNTPISWRVLERVVPDLGQHQPTTEAP